MKVCTCKLASLNSNTYTYSNNMCYIQPKPQSVGAWTCSHTLFGLLFIKWLLMSAYLCQRCNMNFAKICFNVAMNSCIKLTFRKQLSW